MFCYTVLIFQQQQWRSCMNRCGRPSWMRSNDSDHVTSGAQKGVWKPRALHRLRATVSDSDSEKITRRPPKTTANRNSQLYCGVTLQRVKATAGWFTLGLVELLLFLSLLLLFYDMDQGEMFALKISRYVFCSFVCFLAFISIFLFCYPFF